MSERKAITPMTYEEWVSDIPEEGYSMEDAFSAGVTAGRFALNSELGIAANEAAKAERLVVFMTKIRRMDMVPLPESLILQAAKELLG